MSEASKVRHIVSRYCIGNGVDLGSGGDPIVPWAIQFDIARRGHLSDLPIQWVGLDAVKNLPFKDSVLDFVFSAHLLEDFSEWEPLLHEWCRVIKLGGYLIICVPDRERFRAAVASGKNPDNLNHHHESHLGELSRRIRAQSKFTVLVEQYEPNNDYNILFVARRIAV